jgi:hypothetical protein
MKKVGKTLVPRLPKEARVRLGGCARHADKRKKKDKHQKKCVADESPRPQFFYSQF